MAIAGMRGLLFVLSLSLFNFVNSSCIQPSELTGTWIYAVIPSPQLNGSAVRGQPFPPLIHATVDTLVAGLESKLFTSVDLVHVGPTLSFRPPVV